MFQLCTQISKLNENEKVASINLYGENPYLYRKYWSGLIDGPTNLFGIYWNIDVHVLRVCKPKCSMALRPPPPLQQQIFLASITFLIKFWRHSDGLNSVAKVTTTRHSVQPYLYI